MCHLIQYVICVMIAASQASASSYQRQLLVDLLQYYNVNERPVVDHNRPSIVTLSLQIRKILNVDFSLGEVVSSVWLSMDWLDSNLAWKRSRYNNLTSLSLPSDRIWTPDLRFLNGLRKEQIEQTLVSVSDSGRVRMVQPRQMSTSCYASGFLFPFESVSCTFVIGSWTHDSSKIDLVVKTPPLLQNQFETNSEWQIHHVESSRFLKLFDCCPEEPYALVEVNLQFRRRSALLHVFRIHFPLMWLLVVAMFSFCTPCERVDIRIVAGILLLYGAGWSQSVANLPNYFTVSHVFCANMIAALSLSVAINCVQMSLQPSTVSAGLLKGLREPMSRMLTSEVVLKIAMVTQTDADELPQRSKSGAEAQALVLDRLGIIFILATFILTTMSCCVLPWIVY